MNRELKLAAFTFTCLGYKVVPKLFEFRNFDGKTFRKLKLVEFLEHSFALVIFEFIAICIVFLQRNLCSHRIITPLANIFSSFVIPELMPQLFIIIKLDFDSIVLVILIDFPGGPIEYLVIVSTHEKIRSPVEFL